MPFWWPQRQQPPGAGRRAARSRSAPDGTVKVEIDTAVAKAIHPDQDHSYSITAEVVDAVAADDRRHGHGAGRPQAVHGLRLGRSRLLPRRATRSQANFSAQTLDGKPVEGKGELTLLQDQLRQGRQAGRNAGRRRGTSTPTPRAWPSSRSRPPQAGQYRLSYKLTDAKEHTIEGGYLFTVIGEGFDGARVPLQPPRADPRQARVRARREGQAADQHRPRRRHRAAVRPAGQRRLPAAEGPPPGRQEHGRGDRRRRRRTCPTSSSRRSPSPTARSTPRRSEIVVPPEKRVLNVDDRAVDRSLQAGREGQGEAQADRLRRQAVRRLDRGGDLRQVGRVHLRRLERAGDQGVLLEVAAAATTRRPRSSLDRWFQQPDRAERASA